MKFSTSLSSLVVATAVVTSVAAGPAADASIARRRFGGGFGQGKGGASGAAGAKGAAASAAAAKAAAASAAAASAAAAKAGKGAAGSAASGAGAAAASAAAASAAAASAAAAAAGGAGAAAASAAAASAAAASAAAASSAAGANNAASGAAAAAAAGGDPQSSTTLDPRVIATGFANNGQAVPEAGQVASLTSDNNFINFCLTVPNLPITNGKQITTGSCNPAPIGVIPTVDNMPSAKFVTPPNGGTVPANTAFTISMAVQNLVTGNFVNAQENYFAAPQQLDSASGNIIGHTHFVVEALQDGLGQTTPTNPGTFAFFKGVNGAAVNGVVSEAVADGLPAGAYRVCSINSAANHQPVIVPVAQHGALDDCAYFTATDGAAAAAGGANNAAAGAAAANNATAAAATGAAAAAAGTAAAATGAAAAGTGAAAAAGTAAAATGAAASAATGAAAAKGASGASGAAAAAASKAAAAKAAAASAAAAKAAAAKGAKGAGKNRF